jgi:hypothetical protein
MLYEITINRAVEFDPSVAEDVTPASTGIYVGVAGDLKVDLVNGGTVVLKDLVAGVWHPIRAKKIYAVGTLATDIVVSY